MDTQTIYRRRWIILSVLIVGLLAIVIDNTVLNVALKTIAEPHGGLGASQSQLEWAINSYTLVFAGLLFTFGVIGDKVGRKRMLMIGLALFGIASLLSAYSRTPEQLIFARAAMGLGGAAVMPQTLSIISNVFEPAERPRAIGLWATAVGLGIATGPVLGGLLLDHFWWGSVFLINVPVTVLGAIAVAILVPESRNREAGGIDYVGVLLSIAGLVSLVYGIVQGGDGESWLSRGVLGPIVGGLAILAPSPGTRRGSRTRRWTCGCSVTGGCPPRSGRSRWCSSGWAASSSSPASTCRTSGVTPRWPRAC